MTSETERRAQDKLAAAIHRRNLAERRLNRQPLAHRIQDEHDRDMGVIRRQAETSFENSTGEAG